MSYKLHTVCRACGGTDLREVFSFGKSMPLANDFSTTDGTHKGHYPVRVLFCKTCSLAQLGETVDPEVLYRDYAYVTTSGPTTLRHFDRLVKDIVSENGTGSLLEVGANNGSFLDFAYEKGFSPTVGIDPAQNIDNCGHVIIREFFDKASALKTLIADTIVARHVFCHQEWGPFIDTLRFVSHSKTLVAIEVPYCADLLRRCEADSIYSEHTSYLTLKSVVALLKETPWHIHSVDRYAIHGGAVLIMLRRNDSGIREHLNADEMLAEEHVTEEHWLAMAAMWNKKIDALRSKVRELKNAGKTISGFGASAKGTMIVNACGFTRDDIQFVTDNTPFKIGKLVPGTDIPVIDQAEMLAEHPDYAVLFCWNFRDDAIRACEKWLKRGGHFIIPTPDGVEIV